MLRMIGAMLVISGAAGTGLGMSAYVRRSAAILQQLISSLEQMKSEIQFRRTPLPELMRVLSVGASGCVGAFWGLLADELYAGRSRSAAEAMRRCLAARPAEAFSAPTRSELLSLGAGLGSYDADNQTRSINLALSRLGGLLGELRAEQKARVRSCCALGVCAGLALAILMF